MKLDVKELAKSICRAPETNNYYGRPPECESSYLLFHFILPSLLNELVKLSDLDMDAFTEDEAGDAEFFLGRKSYYDVVVPCGIARMAEQAPPWMVERRAFC